MTRDRNVGAKNMPKNNTTSEKLDFVAELLVQKYLILIPDGRFYLPNTVYR